MNLIIIFTKQIKNHIFRFGNDGIVYFNRATHDSLPAEMQGQPIKFRTMGDVENLMKKFEEVIK